MASPEIHSRAIYLLVPLIVVSTQKFIQIDTTCALCNCGLEDDINHLFFSCSFSNFIWQYASSFLKCPISFLNLLSLTRTILKTSNQFSSASKSQLSSTLIGQFGKEETKCYFSIVKLKLWSNLSLKTREFTQWILIQDIGYRVTKFLTQSSILRILDTLVSSTTLLQKNKF